MAGQCADVAYLQAVLDAIEVPRQGPGRPRKRPRALRVDRAYGLPASRRLLQRRGIRCVCPERRDCRCHCLATGRRGGRLPRFDARADKGRNVVQRCINRLKHFRAVATRYDMRGRNFLAGVILAAIFISIQQVLSDRPSERLSCRGRLAARRSAGPRGPAPTAAHGSRASRG